MRVLIYMPHPRTKGSTGYPDTVKDTAHFRHERYRGVGWRWGMGLDLSERRLSELRVLPLLDDMNNWMTDVGTPPKQILAITETYRKQPGNDIYANNPVNYVKLDPRALVDQNLAEHAVVGRLEFHRRLVGLDLGDQVAHVDRIAFPLVPFGKAALGHGRRQRGHEKFDRHGIPR